MFSDKCGYVFIFKGIGSVNVSTPPVNVRDMAVLEVFPYPNKNYGSATVRPTVGHP